MKLHYAGQPGDGYGWGVCNANLRRELAKLVTLTENTIEADVVFMPLADHDFSPATPARGKRNVAYTFFEFELGPNAAARAEGYDVVFCGSSWCLERMKERGITNGKVLIQGVDEILFSPKPPRNPDGTFRIFSGGKFELRKGQDIVIAAFSYFAKRHPEAHLVCAWHNPWEGLIHSMAHSDVLTVNATGNTQAELYHNLLVASGVPASQFTILPQLSQVQLSAQMANTDCGLFPNRCEGGTNLVLMEYLSLNRPAVANLKTGHADLSGADIIEIFAMVDENGWAKQTVSSVINALEFARGASGRICTPPQWTWEVAVRTIVDTIRAMS